MAKVKQKEPRNHLKPAEYWQWMNTITTMWLQSAKLAQQDAIAKSMQKDLEILQLKLKLHLATTLEQSKIQAEEAKGAYFAFKLRLEAAIGQPLDGKVIDDVTHEVKILEGE